MKRPLLILALALAALPAAAHHGVSRYDMETVLTLEATVAEWQWKTPHTGLVLEAEGELWDIEGAPLNWMRNQGFGPDSLAPGEAVTITYHPARQTPREGILMHVDKTDGSRLSVNRPASLGGP